MVRVSGIADIEREIFGPVLHVARFGGDKIADVVSDINTRGYGLTFGLHSRIDRRVQRVLDRIGAGNVYVNRDQIGAVVGSQPFGGHGLSGTGPKAGGAQYLPRFTAEGGTGSEVLPGGDTETVDFELIDDRAANWGRATDRIARLRSALRGRASAAMAASAALDFGPVDLPGPTGESNQLALLPRGRVLCLGPDPEALLAQVVQSLAAGNAVVAAAPDATSALKMLMREDFPLSVHDGGASDDLLRHPGVDLVAAKVSGAALGRLRQVLASREGPVLTLVTGLLSPELYAAERSTCVDTTAAGGNATLLAEAEG